MIVCTPHERFLLMHDDGNELAIRIPVADIYTDTSTLFYCSIVYLVHIPVEVTILRRCNPFSSTYIVVCYHEKAPIVDKLLTRPRYRLVLVHVLPYSTLIFYNRILYFSLLGT